MYKIPANTLFVGKNLIFVPECHSTNSLALELGNLPSTADGTVVITDNQTAGRGQRGNSWEASRGENLTFSVLLKPGFLSVKDRFFLNIFTSLAIHDLLRDKNTNAQIKWPNDVLVSGKKISGILIENQIRGSQVSNSIVGIGLNINQRNFTIPSATSLGKLGDLQYDLNEVLSSLLGFLEKRYFQLKNGHLDQLRSDYLQQLYRYNQPHLFESNGHTFSGTIRGIDEEGLLQVETANGVRAFDIKQISFAA